MAKPEKHFFNQPAIRKESRVEEIIEGLIEDELVEPIEEGKAPPNKFRRFYALRKVSRQSDQHPAYQIEMVAVRDGEIIDHKFLGKPDTLAMVTGKIQEIVDPVNATENENETNFVLP